MQTTPSRPIRISDMHHWKCSGAKVIPNGSWWKHYSSNGVIKVVDNAFFRSSSICQNPVFTYRVKNTQAPASWASDCSMAGRGCLSLWTLVLRWVRSTHTQTFLSLFGTTTTPAYQSVGSLTRVMFLSSIILAISSFTGRMRGMATRWVTDIMKVSFLLRVE